MSFRALYCSCVTVLVVTNVNNYVDSIYHKYHVATEMSPPTVTMADTWDIPNAEMLNSNDRVSL